MKKNCDNCMYDAWDYVGHKPCSNCSSKGNEPPSFWEASENYNPMTNADRIRAMGDEELATVLYGFVDLDSKINYCKNKPECEDLLDTEDGIPTEMCINCLCEWLRRPAEEE